MDSAYTVTDSTDWLQTSLSSFSQLENSLRCQVCKDFFDNPVITSCSHTFCSLCIRRCLSQDSKCPACRASDQASKLRRNWAIEEVVATFQAARPEAFKLATERKQQDEAGEERPAKRRRTQKDSNATPPSSQRQTRSRTKTNNAPAEVMVIDDDEGDGDYEEDKEPDDGLVSCPICSGRMKEEAVYTHIDKCDGVPPSSKKSQTPVNPLQQKPPSRPPSQPPQERLSELNYSMMSDAQMRKKLKEIGISAAGTKELMIRRHKEWVSLWNSNCDSARPKTKRELLHELDVWERSQGGLARESHGSVNGIMKKDFDAKAYANSHSDDFTRLIEEARRKAKRKAEEAKQEGDSEDQRDPNVSKDGLEHSTATQNGDVAVEDPSAPQNLDSKTSPPTNGAVQETAVKSSDNLADSHIISSTEPPVKGTQNEALMSHARFGAASGDGEKGAGGLPGQFVNAPTRKVPMFAISSEPVTDVEIENGKN